MDSYVRICDLCGRSDFQVPALKVRRPSQFEKGAPGEGAHLYPTPAGTRTARACVGTHEPHSSARRRCIARQSPGGMKLAERQDKGKGRPYFRALGIRRIEVEYGLSRHRESLLWVMESALRVLPKRDHGRQRARKTSAGGSSHNC